MAKKIKPLSDPAPGDNPPHKPPNPKMASKKAKAKKKK